MPQPYEVLARLKDGKIAGLSARLSETTESGKTIEGDPVPLSGLDDPVFVDFAKLFSAQAVVERDAAKANGEAALKAAADAKALVDGALATANEQIATLQGMVATAEDRADKAEAKIASLTASVAQLTADCQAALAAQPLGSFSDSLTPLEQVLFGRALETENAAIAKANAEAAARNAAKADGEPLEPLQAPLGATAFFDAMVSERLAALNTPEAQQSALDAAIAKLLALPDDRQAGYLAQLGYASLMKQTPDERHAMLADLKPTIAAKLTALGKANPAAQAALIAGVMGL